MLLLRYVFIPNPYGFLLPKIMSASVAKNSYIRKNEDKKIKKQKIFERKRIKMIWNLARNP